MPGWEEIAAQGISDVAHMGYNTAMTSYWNHWAADREDRAVSRYAADLERAGLSKTLAAGGQAHTMAPIVTNSSAVNLGDAVMRSSMIDLAKRDQDNKDSLAKAQENNLNAESELIRERTKNVGSGTNLQELEIGSYEKRLEAELNESASRITAHTQQNQESAERIRSSQQGRSESQQRIEESRGRVRLNEIQARISEQAITKGEYAIRKLSEEIQHDSIINKGLDLEYKIKMLNAIRASAKEIDEMRSGNSHYSTLGKIATDLANIFDRYANTARNQAVTDYMDEYNRLLKSLTGSSNR